MSGCFDYLFACTPRQDLLIYHLCCDQFLITGLLSPEGFHVQHRVLDLRCIAGAFGLPLPIVPPAVELVPRYGIQRLS
jgi:hypothetical protein